MENFIFESKIAQKLPPLNDILYPRLIPPSDWKGRVHPTNQDAGSPNVGQRWGCFKKLEGYIKLYIALRCHSHTNVSETHRTIRAENREITEM